MCDSINQEPFEISEVFEVHTPLPDTNCIQGFGSFSRPYIIRVRIKDSSTDLERQIKVILNGNCSNNEISSNKLLVKNSISATISSSVSPNTVKPGRGNGEFNPSYTCINLLILCRFYCCSSICSTIYSTGRFSTNRFSDGCWNYLSAENSRLVSLIIVMGVIKMCRVSQFILFSENNTFHART